MTQGASFSENTGAVAEWTADQSAAIRHIDSDLLVSAAAGSGKTAVLAERCAWLVCDAPRPCEVDQLLVVTFTEAAAAEMKQRIAAALRRRLEAGYSQTDEQAIKKRARLTHQLALLDRAQISTLHAFCATLIRRHHAALGLDPGFKILDGDEAELLKREVIRRVFESRYDGTRDGGAGEESLHAFSAFIDDYGDGSDETLMGQVVAAYELLQSVVDPQLWQEEARRRLIEAADRPLDQSELGRSLIRLLREHLEALSGQCERARKIISNLAGFDGYVKLLGEWSAIIAHWRSMIPQSERKTTAGRASDADAWLAALAGEVCGIEWPKLPSIKKDVSGKDLAKGLMDELKKGLKEGPLVQLLKFSQAQWHQGLRDTLPYAELFLSLVDEFSRKYAHDKRARQALDFSDLERFALKVLAGETGNRQGQDLSPAAADCRRRFHHVLVDEYQDINQVQDAILEFVGHGPRATAFYVGDVKQSIYHFRLAEPRRFLERQERFRSAPPGQGRVIDLQKNFRSRAPLLAAINSIFQKLMTAQAAEIEYDQSHHLHPGADYSGATAEDCFSGAPIELHLLPLQAQLSPAQDTDDSEDSTPDDTDRTEREAMLIARRIRQMMQGAPEESEDQPPAASMRVAEKDGTTRPIEYRDIVILLRSLKHKAGEYADVLRQSGIPVHTDRGGDFFESCEVRDMMALLRILDNQAQDISLAAVLRSPLSLVGPSPAENSNSGEQTPINAPDLAAIRIAYSHEAEPPSFSRAARRYAAERTDPLAGRLGRVLDQIGQWRRLAQRRPLAEVIWTIYQDSGYLTYVAGLYNGRQRVANLMHLHQRACQFGGFEQQGLFRFLRFLDQLDQRLDQPSIASAAEDAVRILSIHASKGLEFPVVFLADLGKKFNLSNAQGSILLDRHEGLGLKVADPNLRVRYPSLAWMILSERLKRQALAEELRLLYVAATRAREHLICVGTTNRDKVEKMMNEDAASSMLSSTSLPQEMILSARTPLDWLIPVASQLTTEDTFDVRIWTPEEVNGWPTPRQLRPSMSPWQRDRAALKPLQASPPADPASEQVIQRLMTPYAYEPFTRIAASVAVTSAEDSEKLIELGPQPISTLKAAIPSDSAAMFRGSAYHEVLRFLDFSHSCDEPGILAQIEAMVERHQLSPEQAQLVDAANVCWLMETQMGRLLQKHARQLIRELPFTWARSPAGLSPVDPLDRQIVRGRLDALIPTEEGLVLLDYKTDRVTGERLNERLADYRPQLRLYSQALTEVTNQKVAGAYLVFLHARQICEA